MPDAPGVPTRTPTPDPPIWLAHLAIDVAGFAALVALMLLMLLNAAAAGHGRPAPDRPAATAAPAGRASPMCGSLPGPGPT
jgi:hypothetical protein